MPKKPVPLERDWKHWKELYEMQKAKREEDARRFNRQIELWMQHSISLGKMIERLLRGDDAR